jgi:hypothetical protein
MLHDLERPSSLRRMWRTICRIVKAWGRASSPVGPGIFEHNHALPDLFETCQFFRVFISVPHFRRTSSCTIMPGMIILPLFRHSRKIVVG